MCLSVCLFDNAAVIPTPEVARVYIGSFWDQPLQNDENRKLFEAEVRPASQGAVV